MSESLRQKQSRHVYLVGLLIQWAYQNGYELTWGQTLRTQAEANLNSAKKKGIKNSLHLKSLAVDLNLFKDGKYLTDTESHRPLGEFWESLGPDCRWGGRWGDGNHYSIEYEGVK